MGYAEEFVIGDQAEFSRIIAPGTRVQKLASGFRFLEGPAWYQGRLVFSDIPASRIYQYAADGAVSILREPTNNANGNTVDRQGRLLTCEHSGRRVIRTENDGRITVLADSCEGKKLNSPNDLVEKSDGTIWFSDPPYGTPRYLIEQPANYVFRLDPATGNLAVVASDFDRPNGLCFSPDEKKLYIADSGKPRHVRLFTVTADNTLAGGEIFCGIEPGVPDGMRVDSAGRLFSTAGDGVHIFAPDGHLIGKILVPETPSNCCWGGEGGRTLFMTARTSLYSIRLT